MKNKCVYLDRKPSVPRFQKMSLGKQIQHKIYNGVDESFGNLVHNIYDEASGDVDNGVQFSYRDETTGALIADKFDRAMSDKSSKNAVVSSPIPDSASSTNTVDVSPTVDNNA